MNVFVNTSKGYQWWTFGCGRGWVKLGPISLTVFKWQMWYFELHALNHRYVCLATREAE